MKAKEVFKKYVLVLSVALSFVLSCSGGPGIADQTLHYELITSGDAITTAALVKYGRRFFVQFSPIINPSTGLPYEEADMGKISVGAFFETDRGTEGEAELFKTSALEVNPPVISLDTLYALSQCSTRLEFMGERAPKVDLAFLLDTTQSMTGAVDGIIDTIDAFSDSLIDAGIDAQYSLVTVGDAYNTKSSSGSLYTLGTGDDYPPSFDTIERPLIDFSTLENFKSFATEVKNNFQDYDNGNDNSENYYGAAMAMAGLRDDQNGLTQREGSLFHEIIIGDDCSHTGEVPGDSEGRWIPDSYQAVSALGGVVSIHAVRDDSLDTCSENQLSLAEIAEATGGGKLAYNVDGIDLTGIGLDEYIKKFWIAEVGTCIYETDSFLLSIVLEVADTEGSVRTQNFFFTVTFTTDFPVAS